jgi:hypothetical protein
LLVLLNNEIGELTFFEYGWVFYQPHLDALGSFFQVLPLGELYDILEGEALFGRGRAFWRGYFISEKGEFCG